MMLKSFVSYATLQSPPTVRRNASLNSLARTAPQSPPTSAYVHLPFCRKRCHYCDFPILALGTRSGDDDDDPRITDYVHLICREIQATRDPDPDDPPLQTVYFGGGTPSLVPPKLVLSIVDALRGKFGVRSDVEMSIEMDPGTFDARKMRELVGEVGVNRVSLGVQAFQDEILRGCGRGHGVREVYEALEIVRGCGGLGNWSLDLISSLPYQTLEMWEESLRLAVEALPTHVSVYDLQVEQGTKFGALYTPGEFPLPSDAQSAEFYTMASKTLTGAGYEHYEISSYCKEGYQSKHNQTYWENKPFYGFGLGAASYMGGVRFSRPRKMKEYMGFVQDLENGLLLLDHNHKESIDYKDVAMDVVMLSLRTARGLDVKSYKESFGDTLVVFLCEKFKPYVESGHVIALDEERRTLSADEFSSLLSDVEKLGKVEGVAFIRLSDPEGFLLSNELISMAFEVLSP
ncbi:hypothetical protein Syun_024378 [Stephania yunnanensis]|uniref:Radical S-adenosyl methionine domain-containing protein 1, mitochondrial n=1 Tax=Stephania yunnanensis TaxID=152371 RepID=A0AAP0NHH9_9MAGN